MTLAERMRFNNAINIMDYKILGKNYPACATIEQCDAMRLAVNAMVWLSAETGMNMHKHIAILKYHIKNPAAMIFKDRVTVDALNAGILAIKEMLKHAQIDKPEETEA